MPLVKLPFGSGTESGSNNSGDEVQPQAPADLHQYDVVKEMPDLLVNYQTDGNETMEALTHHNLHTLQPQIAVQASCGLENSSTLSNKEGSTAVSSQEGCSLSVSTQIQTMMRAMLEDLDARM